MKNSILLIVFVVLGTGVIFAQNSNIESEPAIKLCKESFKDIQAGSELELIEKKIEILEIEIYHPDSQFDDPETEAARLKFINKMIADLRDKKEQLLNEE